MPQLLNHLGKPDLDWGVICVYTCESSCDTSGEYATEFVYKQDIVADATNESWRNRNKNTEFSQMANFHS